MVILINEGIYRKTGELPQVIQIRPWILIKTRRRCKKRLLLDIIIFGGWCSLPGVKKFITVQHLHMFHVFFQRQLGLWSSHRKRSVRGRSVQSTSKGQKMSSFRIAFLMLLGSSWFFFLHGFRCKSLFFLGFALSTDCICNFILCMYVCDLCMCSFTSISDYIGIYIYIYIYMYHYCRCKSLVVVQHDALIYVNIYRHCIYNIYIYMCIHI